MNLKDLNNLGIKVQEKINSYDYKEMLLSEEFKKEFKLFLETNSNDRIEYEKYTSVVTTAKGLKIIFPNQWFYISSFFSEFLNSMWDYKRLVDEFKISDQLIKSLRENPVNDDLKKIIKTKITDNKSYSLFELFLTNYNWWFGSKTIDRGDFFVSPVLNLAKVVNVSHSYLADLAYYFSRDEKLTELISRDYGNYIDTANSINTIIIQEKKLRIILLKAFKYILKKYSEDRVLKDFEIKEAKIEDRAYNGIILNKYFGFEVLLGMFDKKQTLEDLKSSGTLRFIDEEFYINDNRHSYFTSQWNENNGRGLSLVNFNKLLNDVSENSLEIIKQENIFKLIEKNINKKNSPLKPLEQIIFYGAPGTGKSHKVEQTLKNINSHFYERITFHPEFDNASFIGSYRPKSSEGKINYEFVPQSFTNIYVKAWYDLENQYYLAIEEINRGNCAEIFGDIFQLLDRNSNYTVSPSEELKNHIIEKLDQEHEGIKNGLKLPPNLTLYATMNTSDQSLFPMDSAFKRRWDWEYMRIHDEEFYDSDKNKPNESFNYIIKDNDGTPLFRWIHFIKEVNKIIKDNQNLGMDKCIGNYFIKSKNNEISLKEFINKAIFYLWNDVFKDEEPSKSIFEQGKYYEDFFPIETNGKDEVIKMAKTLNII